MLALLKWSAWLNLTNTSAKSHWLATNLLMLCSIRYSFYLLNLRSQLFSSPCHFFSHLKHWWVMVWTLLTWPVCIVEWRYVLLIKLSIIFRPKQTDVRAVWVMNTSNSGCYLCIDWSTCLGPYGKQLYQGVSSLRCSTSWRSCYQTWSQMWHGCQHPLLASHLWPRGCRCPRGPSCHVWPPERVIWTRIIKVQVRSNLLLGRILPLFFLFSYCPGSQLVLLISCFIFTMTRHSVLH